MAMEKVEITGLFPRRLRQILESISLDFDQLEEVRLRCGQPVLLRVNGREMGIIGNDQLVELAEQLWKKEDWKKLGGRAENDRGIFKTVIFPECCAYMGHTDTICIGDCGLRSRMRQNGSIWP